MGNVKVGKKSKRKREKGGQGVRSLSGTERPVPLITPLPDPSSSPIFPLCVLPYENLKPGAYSPS